MKKLSKPLSILLSALMLLSVIAAAPFTVSAAQADAEEAVGAYGTTKDCQWRFNEATGEFTVTGNGAMGDYASAENRPWKAFADKITSVSIGSGVTHIGAFAFMNADISSLVVPRNVKSIGECAFDTCEKLSKVYFARGLESIGRKAFRDCALEEIILPDTLKLIGSYAFLYNDKITSVSVPESVTEIMDNALGYGTYGKISDFIICGKPGTTAQTYAEGRGFTFIGQILTGVCGDTLTWHYFQPTKTLFIDGRGEMYDFANPMDHAATAYHSPWLSYLKTGIDHIELDSRVTSIGKYAFCPDAESASVKSVDLPDQLDTIGEYAFYNCSQLTELETPSQLGCIEKYAFAYCSSLKNLELNNSLYVIGDYAFLDCDKLESFEFPERLYAIGRAAFSGCASLTEVLLPEGLTELGVSAFIDCENLRLVILPDSLNSIPAQAFYGCSAIDCFFIGRGVTEIKERAFALDFPDSRRLFIPANVTKIDKNIFIGSDGSTTREKPTIVGRPGSAAETFAHQYGYPFMEGYQEDASYGNIKRISVDGYVAPVAGQTAVDIRDLSIPDDADYMIDSIAWYEKGSGKPLNTPFRFEYGKTYYASIFLKSLNGYTFSERNRHFSQFEYVSFYGCDDELDTSVRTSTITYDRFMLTTKVVTAKNPMQTVSFNAGDGSGEMQSVQVEHGEEYMLPRSTFTPPDGKEFLKWSGNRQPFDKVTVTSDIEFTAYYSNTASILATVREPHEGEALDFSAHVSDERYEVTRVQWQRWENGNPVLVNEGEKAIPDSTYRVFISVGVREKYQNVTTLSQHSTCKINGSEASMMGYGGNSCKFAADFRAIAIEDGVNMVRLQGHLACVIGEYPGDYPSEVTSDVDGCTVTLNGIFQNGRNLLTASNKPKFSSGKYIFRYYLTLDDNSKQYFVDTPRVTFNDPSGKNKSWTVTASLLGGNKRLKVDIEVQAEEPQVIDHAKIEIAPPVLGETPATDFVSYGADRYTVTLGNSKGIIWRYPSLHNTAVEGVFGGEDEFALNVRFTANHGYAFDEDTVFSCNEIDKTASNIYRSITMEFILPANVQFIDAVKLGINQPIVNRQPDYSVVLEKGYDKGYTLNTSGDDGTTTINGVTWFDVEENRALSADETFRPNHIYSVFVSLIAEDGSVFFFNLNNEWEVNHDTIVCVDGVDAEYTADDVYEDRMIVRFSFPRLKDPKSYIPKEPEILIGDVNGDGDVTIDDATMIQKAIAELIELDDTQKKAADANADGQITIDDATMIQKYIAELIDHLG